MNIRRRVEEPGSRVPRYDGGATGPRYGLPSLGAMALASVTAMSACNEPPAETNSVSLAVPIRQPEELEPGRTVLLSVQSDEAGRRVALTARGCEIDLTGSAETCVGSSCCIGVPGGLFAFVVRGEGGECLVRADLVERVLEATEVADGVDAASAFHDRCNGLVVTSAVPVHIAFPASSDTPGDTTDDTTGDATEDTLEVEVGGEVETDETEVGP